MGRFAADVNLPTLYRIFDRLGSPQFILRKAAQLWSVHYDSGKLATIEEDAAPTLSVSRLTVLTASAP